jgi:putative phosphoesterase
MATRIAILTDIHGNAPALRAALAAIDAAGGVDQIHVLGDMVSIGPDINDVLDLLFARPNLDMILGNHEAYVLALFLGRTLALKGEELEHQQWMAARLSPAHADRLEALPTNRTVTYEGQQLLLTHYHSDPVKGLASVEWNPTVESLEARYAGTPYDAVCFGHHHPLHLFRSARRLYLNPGSLGCCDRPVAPYAILTITPGGIDVTLQEAPYENQAFLASYDRLGVPARDFVRKVFHGGQPYPKS